MNLCSATILYNPDETFLSYLLTYSEHVERLYVIDNSEQKKEWVEEGLKKQIVPEKLRYIHNNGVNTGIASSLNKAFDLAALDGFEWVLTMDQDSYFTDKNFFLWAQDCMQHEKIGIIAASFGNKLPFAKAYSAKFHSLLFTVTSGNFVNLHAWKHCHGFAGKLFIDEVDSDFCLRLKRKNYLVLNSNDVLLGHHLGNPFVVKTMFAKKAKHIGIHHPWRMYFAIRNCLYVISKHGIAYPLFGLNRLKNLLIRLGLIMFFYPVKRKYLLFYFMGIKDFVICNYNNNIKR